MNLDGSEGIGYQFLSLRPRSNQLKLSYSSFLRH
nr:MAG TPA: hypothetical protein [Caudoviricetes sp.]